MVINSRAMTIYQKQSNRTYLCVF